MPHQLIPHKTYPAWRGGVRVGPRVGLMMFAGVYESVLKAQWDLDLRGRSKFEDPWISQGRASSGAPAGREYLAGLPQSGAVRVDAILQKVAGPDGDRIVPMEVELRAVGEVIRQRIDADALKLRETAWRGWDYLLEKTGGSKNIYAAAIIEGMKWITTQFDLGNYGASAKAKAMASGSVETALAQMATSIDEGVPYPWHAFEITPLNLQKLRDTITKTKDSQADFSKGIAEVVSDAGTSSEAINLLDTAARSLLCNNQRWFGNKTHSGAPADEGRLPVEVRDVAIGWWSMLLAGLSNAQVVRAFRALHGDAWGAMNLASDEQVVMVAAVVANAYGVPLRELAVKLWEESSGWSAEAALLAQVGCLGLGDYGKTPTNATQVQWWQLARNAVTLASAMKGYGTAPVLPPYAPGKSATAKPVATAPFVAPFLYAGVGSSSGVLATMRRAAVNVANSVRAHKVPYTVAALGAAIVLSLGVARVWRGGSLLP